MTRIVSSGDVTRARDRGAARADACSISGPSATARSSPASTCASRRSRAPTTWSAPGSTTTRSRRRRITARGSRRCSRASCSWSAAIPDVVVERGDRLVYCAGAHRRSLRRHGRRGALCRQAVPADLRHGAGEGGRLRRPQAPRSTRAGDRRFGAHRSQGRARVRRRLPVRDLRHPRRGAGRARAARQRAR